MSDTSIINFKIEQKEDDFIISFNSQDSVAPVVLNVPKLVAIELARSIWKKTNTSPQLPEIDDPISGMWHPNRFG